MSFTLGPPQPALRDGEQRGSVGSQMPVDTEYLASCCRDYMTKEMTLMDSLDRRKLVSGREINFSFSPPGFRNAVDGATLLWAKMRLKEKILMTPKCFVADSITDCECSLTRRTISAPRRLDSAGSFLR